MIHEQRVRERAYYIWEDEGRVFGRAEAHWLQAEAELTVAVEPVLVVEAVAETRVASPAKVLKPAASRAKAKVEQAALKAPKAAKKAEAAKPAPKAALKVRRAPRAAENGAALH